MVFKPQQGQLGGSNGYPQSMFLAIFISFFLKLKKFCVIAWESFCNELGNRKFMKNVIQKQSCLLAAFPVPITTYLGLFQENSPRGGWT